MKRSRHAILKQTTDLHTLAYRLQEIRILNSFSLCLLQILCYILKVSNNFVKIYQKAGGEHLPDNNDENDSFKFLYMFF